MGQPQHEALRSMEGASGRYRGDVPCIVFVDDRVSAIMQLQEIFSQIGFVLHSTDPEEPFEAGFVVRSHCPTGGYLCEGSD